MQESDKVGACALLSPPGQRSPTIALGGHRGYVETAVILRSLFCILHLQKKYHNCLNSQLRSILASDQLQKHRMGENLVSTDGSDMRPLRFR